MEPGAREEALKRDSSWIKNTPPKGCDFSLPVHTSKTLGSHCRSKGRNGRHVSSDKQALPRAWESWHSPGFQFLRGILVQQVPDEKGLKQEAAHCAQNQPACRWWGRLQRFLLELTNIHLALLHKKHPIHNFTMIQWHSLPSQNQDGSG